MMLPLPSLLLNQKAREEQVVGSSQGRGPALLLSGDPWTKEGKSSSWPTLLCQTLTSPFSVFQDYRARLIQNHSHCKHHLRLSLRQQHNRTPLGRTPTIWSSVCL